MSGQVQEGDKGSWKLGASNPSGTIGEVKAGEVTVTSNHGNEISKTGDESNPAVHIERSGNDDVKTANELEVKSKDSESEEKNGTSENEEKKKEPENKSEDAKTGDKRKADEKTAATEDEKDEKKKQKKTNGTATAATNGNSTKPEQPEKKRPGRPKGQGNGAKKEKKELAVGKAQRKTRSQVAAEKLD